MLWLGPEGEGPAGVWEIEPQIDRGAHIAKRNPRFRVSAVTGEGLAELKRALVETALQAMPKPGEAALNARQRALLVRRGSQALEACTGAGRPAGDLPSNCASPGSLSTALTGRAATEDMLDALFGRFCIGK